MSNPSHLYTQLKTSNDLINTITVLIVTIYIFFPVRSLISKCVGENEALLDESNYGTKYLFFPTDYDRENPVTKQQGELRFIQAQLKQMENEKEEEDGGAEGEGDEQQKAKELAKAAKAANMEALKAQMAAVKGASKYDAMRQYANVRDVRMIQHA